MWGNKILRWLMHAFTHKYFLKEVLWCGPTSILPQRMRIRHKGRSCTSTRWDATCFPTGTKLEEMGRTLELLNLNPKYFECVFVLFWQFKFQTFFLWFFCNVYGHWWYLNQTHAWINIPFHLLALKRLREEFAQGSISSSLLLYF